MDGSLSNPGSRETQAHPRIRRCAQSAGGTNCRRLSKSRENTSLADSITNIGESGSLEFRPNFLRTTVGTQVNMEENEPHRGPLALPMRADFGPFTPRMHHTSTSECAS